MKALKILFLGASLIAISFRACLKNADNVAVLGTKSSSFYDDAGRNLGRVGEVVQQSKNLGDQFFEIENKDSDKDLKNDRLQLLPSKEPEDKIITLDELDKLYEKPKPEITGQKIKALQEKLKAKQAQNQVD